MAKTLCLIDAMETERQLKALQSFDEQYLIIAQNHRASWQLTNLGVSHSSIGDAVPLPDWDSIHGQVQDHLNRIFVGVVDPTHRELIADWSNLLIHEVQTHFALAIAVEKLLKSDCYSVLKWFARPSRPEVDPQFIILENLTQSLRVSFESI